MKVLLLKITLNFIAIVVTAGLVTGAWVFVFYPTLAIPEGRVLALIVFSLTSIATEISLGAKINEALDKEYGANQ